MGLFLEHAQTPPAGDGHALLSCFALWSQQGDPHQPSPLLPPGQGSPSVDSSSVVTLPRPSTPSRISFFTRQSSFSTEAPSPTPRSPGTPTGSPSHRPGRWEEVSELEGNYLEYLRDARLNIDHCVRACRVWSAPYDGEEPSASSLAPPLGVPSATNMSVHPRGGPPDPAPTSPRTKKRGASLEGAPVSLPPSTPPPPDADARDKSALLNGAHVGAGIKKVRWCPKESPLENGSVPAPGPWESTSCLDLLMDEVLSQAPLENGGPLTVEKFHLELCQLEDEMANGGRAEEALVSAPPPETDPLSLEEEEAYRHFSSYPEGAAPARPADPLAQIISSPPRTSGQPPSQPSTGEFLQNPWLASCRGPSLSIYWHPGENACKLLGTYELFRFFFLLFLLF